MSDKDLLEIQDFGQPPMKVSYGDLLKRIFERKLSLKASIKDPQSGAWKPLQETGDFQFAYPSAPLGKSLTEYLKGDVVRGAVVISSKPERLLEIHKKNPQAFIIPILAEGSPTFVRDAALFELWDKFYVGCALESNLIEPGENLNVHLIAFNLCGYTEKHALVPYGCDVPDDQKPQLVFDLQPWSWDVHKLSIPVKKKEGEHKLEFRTASRAARAVEGALATALTLGIFIHAPGYKGFYVKFLIPKQNIVNSANQLKAACMEAVKLSLTKIARLKTVAGEEVSKEEYSQRFKQFLNLETISDIMKELIHDGVPEEVLGKMFCTRAATKFEAFEYGRALTVEKYQPNQR